jgi:transcriptional regulator with XRE-family HTH domain
VGHGVTDQGVIGRARCGRGIQGGILGHMLGDLIRDLRTARGWTQETLSDALGEVSDRPGLPGRDQVKRWENGKVIPSGAWLGHLAHVLGVPLPALRSEATLSRMERRAFLSLTALTAAHGRAASDMLCSVVGGDAGPLATVQTTHGTDLVIASMADKTALRYLRRWATGGADPVLHRARGRRCPYPRHGRATPLHHGRDRPHVRPRLAGRRPPRRRPSRGAQPRRVPRPPTPR